LKLQRTRLAPSLTDFNRAGRRSGNNRPKSTRFLLRRLPRGLFCSCGSHCPFLSCTGNNLARFDEASFFGGEPTVSDDGSLGAQAPRRGGSIPGDLSPFLLACRQITVGNTVTSLMMMVLRFSTWVRRSPSVTHFVLILSEEVGLRGVRRCLQSQSVGRRKLVRHRIS